MSNPTPVSPVSYLADALQAPINGGHHETLNRARTRVVPNFPKDISQPEQTNTPQGSGLPPPERDVRVLAVDLISNIPYSHWATGWRPGLGSLPIPDYTIAPCSDIEVLDTLEKGSLGWWQEILAISAEDLYYAGQDYGNQATHEGHPEWRDGPASLVSSGRPEYQRTVPLRKQVNRAAMVGIAIDIMATWASAERRVVIKDLMEEEPGKPEELDEGLFVYHTDADKVALRKRFDARYAKGLEEGRQMALQHERLEERETEERAVRDVAWLTEQLEAEREQELAWACQKEIEEKQRQEVLAKNRLQEEERLRLLLLADRQKDEEEIRNIRAAIRKRNVPWRHLVLLYNKINEIESIGCTCPSPDCPRRSQKLQRKQLTSTYKTVTLWYDWWCNITFQMIEKYQTRHNLAGPKRRMELRAVIDNIYEEELRNFKCILDDIDAMLKAKMPLLAVDFHRLRTDRRTDVPL